jgi:hypothetical protein
MSLATIDAKITEIATKVAGAFDGRWSQIRYVVRWNPDGDVSRDDYWVKTENLEATKRYPDVVTSVAISNATRSHWRLVQDLKQPRWYKMTMTVERAGNFNVEFEYKDDYREGDISRDA